MIWSRARCVSATSSEPVFGHQPEAGYNAHYHATVYHPLVATAAETGDLLDLDLRRGIAHTAEGDLGFIERLIDRIEKHVCQVAAVRIDAGETLLANDPSARAHRGLRVMAEAVNKVGK